MFVAYANIYIDSFAFRGGGGVEGAGGGGEELLHPILKPVASPFKSHIPLRTLGSGFASRGFAHLKF